ncbi:MAG: YIP1 family protein [Nanoarchaeota archaeon]
MDFFKKLKEVLVKPSKFFLEIEKEKTIKPSFIYISVLTVFYSVMSIILLLLFKDYLANLFLNMFNLPTEQPFSLSKQLIFIIVGIPASILFSFVLAAILYVWLMIFGSDKDYKTAYKLLVYSETPSLLFGWIPIVNWFSWIYSLVLLIKGTHKIYKFSKLKSSLIYIIPLGIFLILLLILFIMFSLILISLGNQMPQTF